MRRQTRVMSASDSDPLGRGGFCSRAGAAVNRATIEHGPSLPSLPAALVGLVAVAVVAPPRAASTRAAETAATLASDAPRRPRRDVRGSVRARRPGLRRPRARGRACGVRGAHRLPRERGAARRRPAAAQARGAADAVGALLRPRSWRATTTSPGTTTRTGAAPAGSCASATGPIASRPSTRAGTRSARTSPPATRARRRSWPPGWARPCTARRSSAAITGRRAPATRPAAPRATTGCRTSAGAAAPSRSCSTARLRARARGACGVFVYGDWREMRVRNDDEAFSPWRTFEREFEWTLRAAPGVRARSRWRCAARRAQAASASDSIRLEAQPT